MTVAKFVCELFTLLIIFGFGYASAKDADVIEAWKFWSYLLLIAFGLFGMHA